MTKTKQRSKHPAPSRIKETREDTFDARINAKATEITAEVGALLGDRYTRNDLERGLLFDAAWARVKLEDQRRATEEACELNRKLMAINEELLAIVNKVEAERIEGIAGWREMSARATAFHDSVEAANKIILPLAERGEAWTTTQRKNGLRRFEAERKKHDNWRRWQASEKAENTRFAVSSKQEQARRLKKKHAIAEDVPTIAKKLNPLPKKKRA